jgi:hypothetical protein
MRKCHNNPINDPPKEEDKLGLCPDFTYRHHLIVRRIDQIDDLIGDARRTLDRFDDLPNARSHLERIVEDAHCRMRELYHLACDAIDDLELAQESDEAEPTR